MNVREKLMVVLETMMCIAGIIMCVCIPALVVIVLVRALKGEA